MAGASQAGLLSERNVRGLVETLINSLRKDAGFRHSSRETVGALRTLLTDPSRSPALFRGVLPGLLPASMRKFAARLAKLHTKHPDVASLLFKLAEAPHAVLDAAAKLRAPGGKAAPMHALRTAQVVLLPAGADVPAREFTGCFIGVGGKHLKAIAAQSGAKLTLSTDGAAGVICTANLPSAGRSEVHVHVLLVTLLATLRARAATVARGRKKHQAAVAEHVVYVATHRSEQAFIDHAYCERMGPSVAMGINHRVGADEGRKELGASLFHRRVRHCLCLVFPTAFPG